MTEAGTRGVLDTSTVILLGRPSDPWLLPTDSVVSAITLAELSAGPQVARVAKERVARQALAEDVPIYTSNLGDFEGSEGLEVAKVPQLAS